MKYLLIVPLLLAIGCAHSASKAPNSIPVTGSSVEKAQAHVESATGLVVRATPESNVTGKALLAAAKDEQDKAVSDLKQAKAELAQVSAERNTLVNDNVALTAALAKVKGGWGYRLQMFVLKLFWLIVGLTALHYILGLASLFITGPVGGVMAKVGLGLNPLAWFQSLRDHLHFKKSNPCA